MPVNDFVSNRYAYTLRVTPGGKFWLQIHTDSFLISTLPKTTKCDVTYPVHTVHISIHSLLHFTHTQHTTASWMVPEWCKRDQNHWGSSGHQFCGWKHLVHNRDQKSKRRWQEGTNNHAVQPRWTEKHLTAPNLLNLTAKGRQQKITSGSQVLSS